MPRIAIMFLLALLTLVGPRGFAGDAAPNLPVVFLETKKPISSKQPVPCFVRVAPPDRPERDQNRLLVGTATVHGANSSGYSKKSFSLSLAESAALAGLRTNRHWLLNAAFIDRSLMRHKLSYDLFSSLSAANAPRRAVASRFVEVQLNGAYHGVYLLMERADRHLLGLEVYRAAETNHACLYKAIDHGADFGSLGHGSYVQREPDPKTREYWSPLEEFNRFVSSSSAEQFFHPQTGIEARLDVDNAIDFHLLVLLTSNTDGIDKNFFFARHQSEPGRPAPRFFFAPWDYDGSFGRDWDGSRVSESVWLSTHLFDRLLANQDYRERFAARWNQLRERQFSVKSIHEMIDANVRTLGPAAQRNFARWPTTAGGYPDRLTFEQDIAQMKEWVEKRVSWLDRQINARPKGRRP